MVLASKTGCTVGTPFTLEPQYAALRLNFYGLNSEVSKIVVTNTTANPKVSYTLNCSTAVRVGNSEETATPFLLVVPSDASSWNFKVGVTAGNATTGLDPVPSYKEGNYTGDGIVIATGTFTTSSAKTFSAGKVLNMPAKLITTIWAPVNCGYDATHPYGRYYQFGRKVGGGYNSTEGKQAATKATWTDGYNKNPDDNKFYYVTSTDPKDWYTNNSSKQMGEWPILDPEGTTGIGNPCPNGWRVPTKDELIALMGGHTGGTVQKGNHGTLTNINGKYFDGSTSSTPTSGVFLPNAGIINFENCTSHGRESDYYNTYWSSTVDGIGVNILYYDNSQAKISTGSRAGGRSVRCVVDENAVHPGATLPDDMQNASGSW